MSTTHLEGSVRDRLLAAANELFYQEGIHAVGIERVLERAGVAKASLYSTFGSKDELVRAYLLARHQRRQARVNARIARHESPRDKILAIFDLVAELAAEPNFRGCAFVRASSEGPAVESKVTQVCADTRAWAREISGSSSVTAASAPRPITAESPILNLRPACVPAMAIKRAGPVSSTLS